MLSLLSVLKAVADLLKTKYPSPETSYYTDEIVEGFKEPCFFIKLIKTKNTETKNTNRNSLSIIITYFADENKNRQLAFIDCQDSVENAFSIGFSVAERFLHVKTISAERIGEKNDILQMTVSIEYLDDTGYDPDAGYDLMQKVKLNIK